MRHTLFEYIEMIEDILKKGKVVPFSGRVSVDIDQLNAVLTEMHMNVPDEIRRAQRLIDDHDRIIEDAKAKAESIKKEAENEAKLMLASHEIYRRATDAATDLIAEAKQNARDLRLNALDYTDEKLEKTEAMIREAMENISHQFKLLDDYFTQTVEILYDNRQSLRGEH